MDSLHLLHHCKIHNLTATVNRSHTLLHSLLLVALIYHRISSIRTLSAPLLPWLMVFASELLLSFLWLLSQAYGWRIVSREVFPERLPGDQELPAIDVFVCTADAKKEPPVQVMNTVLSAMAMDYPPEKLSMYLSDDGGSSLMLYAAREAWAFASSWIHFCRRNGLIVKTRCPEAFFSTFNDGHRGLRSEEFTQEKDKIEREYEQFKERLRRAGENGVREDPSTGQNHPSMIEVIGDNYNVNSTNCSQAGMPLLVYVSREKRPSHPHHFKAGALNVLLRVSSIISNAPYILTLDCDMYSNDPTSARQAMCFHLDRKLSPSLALVQFPQKFHNISKSDIYDSALRSIFMVKWPGMDGLRGPMLSGTCFYIKRKALYGTYELKDKHDLLQLQKSFGPSNEFIASIDKGFRGNNESFSKALQKETKILASCTYESHTQWGQQIGFLYDSVVEDYFTGFILHCSGWTSVYCDPSRPAFLGSCTTSLNDTIVQGTRWNSGLLQVGFSRFCPIFYGPFRMSILESMCYAYLAFQPLYCLPLWCLAIVPQLCLLNGLPVYPKVSSPWFVVLSFIFLSSLLEQLLDVLITGGSIQTWWNEWRIWMIKSVTAYSFGTLDTILQLIGTRKASFMPTNKVSGEEQVQLYQMGIFDFRTPTIYLAPLVTLVVLNLASFIGGVSKLTVSGGWDEMFAQVFLSFFVLVVNFPIIEGMVLRKDRGRVPTTVTLLSALLSLILLSLGYVFLMCVLKT